MSTKSQPPGGITVKPHAEGVSLSLAIPGFPGILVTRATFAEALRALAEHVERREASFPTPVGVA
jgi:hypothetical protein